MATESLKFRKVTQLPAAAVANKGTIYFNDTDKTINICNGTTYSTYKGTDTNTWPSTYAGSSSAGGSATSAVKLDSSAGSSTVPIYFSSGKPTAVSSIDGSLLKYSAGPDPGALELSTIDTTQGDRLAFLPADQIIVEKTTDGGLTWVSAEMSDSQKTALFTSKDMGGERLSIPLLNGVKSCNCMVRITMTGMKYNVPDGTAETDKINYWNSTYVKSNERYWGGESFLNFWISSNSDRIQCKLEMQSGASTSWTTMRTVNKLSGWSGRDTMATGNVTFGGGPAQTGNTWNWRLTFRTQALDGSFDDSKLSTSYQTSTQVIYSIRAYSENAWTTPNNMTNNGHLYSWDVSQNATFPGSIRATNLYVNNTEVSVSGHTHTSANVTSLSGYSKASSYSAITATDSLNTALGKLSAAVDGIETLLASI